jgi:hypothetical protein
MNWKRRLRRNQSLNLTEKTILTTTCSQQRNSLKALSLPALCFKVSPNPTH